MHFFNPVLVMKLIEIIPGLQTSARTLDLTKKLATKMGKIIVTAKDSPGFLVNRMLLPYLNEAVFLL